MTGIYVSDLIKGAGVFAVALAWNSAAKEVIDAIYPVSKEGAWASVFYAFFVTMFMIFVFYMYNGYRFIEKMV